MRNIFNQSFACVDRRVERGGTADQTFQVSGSREVMKSWPTIVARERPNKTVLSSVLRESFDQPTPESKKGSQNHPKHSGNWATTSGSALLESPPASNCVFKPKMCPKKSLGRLTGDSTSQFGRQNDRTLFLVITKNSDSSLQCSKVCWTLEKMSEKRHQQVAQMVHTHELWLMLVILIVKSIY